MRSSPTRNVMSWLRKTVRKYFLLLFLLSILTLALVTQVDPGEIWQAASALRAHELLVLLAVYAVAVTASIATRSYLLRSLGFRTRADHLSLIHFTSMAAHYSTPAKVGFPLAVYLLNRVEQVSYAAGTAMILIELVVGMGVCGAFAAVGALQFFGVDLLPAVVVGGCLLAGGCVAIAVGPKLLLRRRDKWGRLRRFVADVSGSFRGVPFPKLTLYCCLMALCQVISGVYSVLLLHFLGVPISIWQAIVANSTAFFLGAVSMVPMGLGVNEVSMLFCLGRFGVPNEIAITMIALQRLLITGVSYLLGLVAGGVLGVKNMRTEADAGGVGGGDESERRTGERGSV